MSISEALSISATGFIVVLIILALLACIIVLISKLIQAFEKIGNKKTDKSTKVEEVSRKNKSTPTEVTANNVPAGLELYKTSEQTAATIMAIVSHESGIPLNRLDFKSIRLVDSLELYKIDDKTAATIMAIVSHQSGIPLDRLVFKSIKLIEK